jgi:site-specific DNA-methyltransferase (adenine-specific)
MVKTYTNEGETVLDNTMGSCTTGLACLNTSRNFIGIEISEEYYGVSKERVEKWQEDNGLK